MLILTPFFEGPGEELRIPPSSVVASILMIQKDERDFRNLASPHVLIHAGLLHV
jgi:hypothetical protein